MVAGLIIFATLSMAAIIVHYVLVELLDPPRRAHREHCIRKQLEAEALREARFDIDRL